MNISSHIFVKNESETFGQEGKVITISFSLSELGGYEWYLRDITCTNLLYPAAKNLLALVARRDW